MATLGIFVKEPVPGNVKTRLGQEIGDELSAQLYEAFLKDFTKTVSLLTEVEVVFAFSPSTESAVKYFRNLGDGNQSLWAQPKSELGDRMRQFFEQYLNDNNPVVIVGSDSPTLPENLIENAFEILKKKDVVLGPAVDGGYYLVGQSIYIPEMFEDIVWSQADVLQQTVQRLKESKVSLGLLPPWYDIDSLDDLQFLQGHLDALELAGNGEVRFPNIQSILGNDSNT